METCTFFGHRDCSDAVLPSLRAAVYDLIEAQGVDRFFVGNQGNFDRLVLLVLREAKTAYPHIRYAVVLAYMPSEDSPARLAADETLFPEGIEVVPKRFAISWRNRWMIDHADYVICYTTHTWGGAVQFMSEAKRKQRKIINLPECCSCGIRTE